MDRCEAIKFRLQVAKALLLHSRARPSGLRREQSLSFSATLESPQLRCEGPVSMGWENAKLCSSCKARGYSQGRKRQLAKISDSMLNSR